MTIVFPSVNFSKTLQIMWVGETNANFHILFKEKNMLEQFSFISKSTKLCDIEKNRLDDPMFFPSQVLFLSISAK